MPEQAPSAWYAIPPEPPDLATWQRQAAASVAWLRGAAGKSTFMTLWAPEDGEAEMHFEYLAGQDVVALQVLVFVDGELSTAPELLAQRDLPLSSGGLARSTLRIPSTALKTGWNTVHLSWLETLSSGFVVRGETLSWTVFRGGAVRPPDFEPFDVPDRILPESSRGSDVVGVAPPRIAGLNVVGFRGGPLTESWELQLIAQGERSIAVCNEPQPVVISAIFDGQPFPIREGRSVIRALVPAGEAHAYNFTLDTRMFPPLGTGRHFFSIVAFYGVGKPYETFAPYTSDGGLYTEWVEFPERMFEFQY